MGMQEAFLADIAEHPDDDAPRLAYADWLMEQADPALAARGEYVALQCRMLREDGVPRRRMKAQTRALLRTHRKAWLEGLTGIGDFELSRGLVERVRLRWGESRSRQDYLDAVGELFRREPVIRHLHLEHLDLGGDLFSDILSLSNMPALITLSVGAGATFLEPIELVGGIRSLAFLRRLIVLEDEVGPRARLHPLVEYRFRHTLEALIVTGRRLEDDDVTALTAAEWPRLVHLDLSGNAITEVGLHRLGTGRGLPALNSLALGNLGLGWDSVAALATAPLTYQLRRLTLWDGGPGPDAGELEALIGALMESALECLTLPDSYALGPNTREALQQRYGARITFELSRW